MWANTRIKIVRHFCLKRYNSTSRLTLSFDTLVYNPLFYYLNNEVAENLITVNIPVLSFIFVYGIQILTIHSFSCLSLAFLCLVILI